MTRLMLGLVVAAALFVGISGCGGSSDSSSVASTTPAAAGTDSDADQEATAAPASSGPADETVKISAPASGDLAFEPANLKAKAGNVEFDFSNPSSVEHNFCIRSEDGTELGCSDDTSAGETSLTVKLDPGSYVFYCGEPGHEEGGMTGTLRVS